MHLATHPGCMAAVKSLCGMANSMQRQTHSGGRPKSADRCPCGIMTAARAAARKHVCSVGENAE